MTRLTTIGLVLALVACADGSGPGPQQYAGIWAGSFAYGKEGPATAQLQLAQSGQTVSGQLASSSGHSATLDAEARPGDQLEGTLDFTGACPATATLTASLVDEVEPDELHGSFSATDCNGADVSGGFILLRQ